MKRFLAWLNRNLFVKHLILIVSCIVILVFVSYLLLNLFTRHNKHEVVPDFTNMTMEQAEGAARSGKLNIEINDSRYDALFEPGVILSQIPEPGTEVKSGRSIFVTVNASSRRMVRIPYVTGVSLRQAKNDLDVAGFEIEELVYRTDIATDYVLETRYNNQALTDGSTVEAEQGSGITLIVGMNPEQTEVIVPKVVGFTYREAKGRLWENGLNVGKTEFDPDVTLRNRKDSRVWRQVPEQGSKVTRGTKVTIMLTLDREKVDTGSSASDKEAQRIITLRRAEEELAASRDSTEQAEPII